MKLTAKLVAAVMLGSIIVTVADAYVAVQHRTREFQQEAVAEAQRLGTIMEETFVTQWRQDGQEHALQSLRKVGSGQELMNIRFVWFDAPPGDPHRPRTPPELLEAQIIKRRVTISQGPLADPEYQYAYWPLQVDDRRRGGFELSKSTATLKNYKGDVINRTLLHMGAMVLLTGLVMTLVGMRVVGRPLEQLIEKTRRVAAGDLTGPVQIRSGDELGKLAESLNEMCHQLSESKEAVQVETAARDDAVEQLRHVDRLGLVGTLASGIAHELGTPLAVVGGRAALIASGKLSIEESQESARTIKAETDRITRIIRELLDFARRKSPHRMPVDLQQIARQTIELLDHQAVRQNYKLVLEESTGSTTAMVDVAQLQQVLSNLIVNAAQAMPGGRKIELGIRRERTRPPDRQGETDDEFLCVYVRDSGQGISRENLERVFEPFFTTKGAGEGTGLGLSISSDIVKEHGGWIDIESELGKGSCFSVYLPKEINACPDES